MQYALVNGERSEAQPGLDGRCRLCGSSVNPKCGKIRVHHWAHEQVRNCDSWGEKETPWHRAGKAEFPESWREIVHFAEDGEKHIADVKTEYGLVIEFQYSHLKREEIVKRERFYGAMLWFVSGLRRIKDKNDFFEVLKSSAAVPRSEDLRIITKFDGSALLRDWFDRNEMVFFDFGEEVVWGLLPKAPWDQVYIWRVDREVLFTALQSGPTFSRLRNGMLFRLNPPQWYKDKLKKAQRRASITATRLVRFPSRL